ncbi:MAG: methyltransferase domain-containing protein [Desulfuromonadales bacterium]|nr:methyltransferase domain-containing protein [Desulfuromonadales bacterium]
MADVYATIADAEHEVQERLAIVLERRAADLQQQGMLRAYLADMELPDGARVLEVGCGTGAVSRELARRPGIGQVIGVDPSPVFLAAARTSAENLPNLEFVEGDGRALPFQDNCFDALIFHTTLSHVPEPQAALAEAFRVLRPGGVLAVFDGNYTTTNLATGDFDPLQACADAAMAALVHDRWLIPRLPALVKDAGFTIINQRSFGFVETTAPDYMLTVVDRGADVLAASGRIGAELATALKAEARNRVANGNFFGSITYASMLAKK